jgi:hypothetical protein
VRLHLIVPLGLFFAAAAFPAAAQTRDAAGAEVLYRAGREAARRGDWETACGKLAESQRLDPAGGTLLNLADCEEHRGQLAHAWQHFVQAQALLPKGDARATYAKTRAAAVDKRLPRLNVHLAEGSPAGTHVLRDDQELGAPSLGVSLPVDPGEHVVVARADGHVDGRVQVSLAEGDTRDVTVTLGPTLTATAATAGAPPTPAPYPTPPPATTPTTTYTPLIVPEKRPAYAYAFLGAGALGIGVGAVAGGLALSRASTVKDACGPAYATCNDASVAAAKDGKLFTTVSTVGFAAGAVFAGVGLYFLLAPSSSKSASPPASASAALTIAPNGAAVTGSF